MVRVLLRGVGAIVILPGPSRLRGVSVRSCHSRSVLAPARHSGVPIRGLVGEGPPREHRSGLRLNARGRWRTAGSTCGCQLRGGKSARQAGDGVDRPERRVHARLRGVYAGIAGQVGRYGHEVMFLSGTSPCVTSEYAVRDGRPATTGPKSRPDAVSSGLAPAEIEGSRGQTGAFAALSRPASHRRSRARRKWYDRHNWMSFR